MEIWKPVVGWEDLYEVSSLGRVRSLPRITSRGGRQCRLKGGIRKLLPYGRGYLGVRLCMGGKEVGYYVHRLVLDAFKGPPPSVWHVARHMNAVRTDNRPENLEWGTPQDNADDRKRHGNCPIGDAHHNRKLTSDAVREIRASTEPASALGARFGVSHATILDAKSGRTWGHVHD